MKQGAYHKRLRVTFIAIAVVFVLVFGVLMSGIVIATQRANNSVALQHTIAAKSDTIRVTLSTVSNALRAIQSSEAAIKFANSETHSIFYYYNAISLYNTIGKSIVNVSLVDYDIYVTQPQDESFVIGNGGSLDKEMFFSEKESGLMQDDWATIKQHFATSDAPYVLPVYYQDKLKDVYYIEKDIKEKSPLIYFLRLPANTLFGKDKPESCALFDNNSMLAYSTSQPEEQKTIDGYYDFLKEKTTSALETYARFEYKGNELFLVRAGNFAWSIAFLYEFDLFSMPQTFLLILLPLALFSALAIIIFTKLSDVLYRPIQKVIRNVYSENVPNDTIDEFQIIWQNVNTVSALNAQLETAISENNAMATRRYYRELLYGVPDLNCPLSAQQMSASYCVAVVEFTSDSKDAESDDWYFHLQKNYLYVHVQEMSIQNSIQYISAGYNLAAVIMQVQQRHEAEEIVAQFFTVPDITATLKIAVSDTHEEVIRISDCYREALQLLEFRYALPGKQIITSDFASAIPKISYYYPLVVENRLIQAMASGNPSCIALYDEIILENFANRELAPEVLRNLIFAMISTLMRVFQELKTTPSALLGEEIDFQALHASWSSVDTREALRTYIENIVQTIQQKSTSNDDKLLQSMLAYIYNNYQDDIMLQDIAQHCNISPAYCSTLFKRLCSDNFKAFLNRYRITRACEILQTNPYTKIVDLSTSVGFNSANSFIRAFGKITGMTPKVYADKISSIKLQR